MQGKNAAKTSNCKKAQTQLMKSDPVRLSNVPCSISKPFPHLA